MYIYFLYFIILEIFLSFKYQLLIIILTTHLFLHFQKMILQVTVVVIFLINLNFKLDFNLFN